MYSHVNDIEREEHQPTRDSDEASEGGYHQARVHLVQLPGEDHAVIVQLFNHDHCSDMQ